MIVRKLLPVLIVSTFIFGAMITLLPGARAVGVHLVPHMPDCYSTKPDLGSNFASFACDNITTGNRWIDDGSAGYFFFYLNLSSNFVVHHFNLIWDNHPSNGSVEWFTGTTWVKTGNFSGSVGNDNQTVTLDQERYSSRFRFLLNGNVGFVGMYEFFAYGDVNYPPVISPKISQDSTGCSESYRRDFNATDLNSGQTLSWSMVTDASGIVVGSANGTVYGSIAATTQYFVNVTVSDGIASDFVNYTLTITCIETVITEAATVVGHSSVVLNGNLTFIGDVDGFAQVQFDYGTTLAFGFQTNLVTKHGTGNFSALVYDLDPGTLYYFRAVAIGHSAGVSNGYGGALTFTTTGGIVTLDQTALTLILFVIAIVIVSALGYTYHPAFFILDGIIIISFGIWAYTAVASLLLSVMFVASGAILAAIGTFARPKPKKPIA